MTERGYLIRLDDCDGNDNRVYDVLIAAQSTREALDKAWKYVKEEYPEDEEDGSYGTYHPCHCECEHGLPAQEAEEPHKGRTKYCDPEMWDCSHGGVVLSEEVREYPTVEKARKARLVYHTLVDLT